jgi:hypothetical protein
MNKAEGSTMRGRVVCLDPYELALRGFVWKLGPFYSGGVFDKDQRLKCIIGKMVIIGTLYRAGVYSHRPGILSGKVGAELAP